MGMDACLRAFALGSLDRYCCWKLLTPRDLFRETETELTENLDALSETHQVIYENGGLILKDLCPPLQCGEDHAV